MKETSVRSFANKSFVWGQPATAVKEWLKSTHSENWLLFSRLSQVILFYASKKFASVINILPNFISREKVARSLPSFHRKRTWNGNPLTPRNMSFSARRVLLFPSPHKFSTCREIFWPIPIEKGAPHVKTFLTVILTLLLFIFFPSISPTGITPKRARSREGKKRTYTHKKA